MKVQRKRRRRPMKTKTQKMAQDARKKSMSKKDYNRQESKRATREASTEE